MREAASSSAAQPGAAAQAGGGAQPAAEAGAGHGSREQLQEASGAGSSAQPDKVQPGSQAGRQAAAEAGSSGAGPPQGPEGPSQQQSSEVQPPASGVGSSQGEPKPHGLLSRAAQAALTSQQGVTAMMRSASPEQHTAPSRHPAVLLSLASRPRPSGAVSSAGLEEGSLPSPGAQSSAAEARAAEPPHQQPPHPPNPAFRCAHHCWPVQAAGDNPSALLLRCRGSPWAPAALRLPLSPHCSTVCA